MTDEVASLVGAVTREVRNIERAGRPARMVIASRVYDTDIDDLWNAISTVERIPRWFMPISGELRVGGRYQLQGNAGGIIERCEPPRELAVTWEYGCAVSWVVVKLAPDGAGARLTLEHTAHIDPEWDGKGFGSGAVGIGWDLGLMGLHRHIASGGAAIADPAQGMAWMMSDEGKRYIGLTSDDWGRADIAGGSWDRDEALKRAETTRKAYSGEV